MSRVTQTFTNATLALIAAISIGLGGCGDDDAHLSRYNHVYIESYQHAEPVTFQLNNAETLTVDAPGVYRFRTQVEYDTRVSVKVIQQPSHQICYTKFDAGYMPPNDIVLEYVCDDFHRGLASATEIAVGDEHSCAIENGAVTCWGNNENHQTDAPANLSNPRQLGASVDHSCVLADEGVFCWGALEQDHPVPANLGNPDNIFVDRESVCAIDNTGTPTCWGELEQEYLDLIDTFSGISQIGIGDNNVCTRAQDTLTCWRIFPATEITLQRTVSSDTQLYFGYLQNCMISSFTVECWDNNDDYSFYWSTPPTPPSPLTAPSTLSPGTLRACLIDSGNVLCWPEYWFGLNRIPDAINNAEKISAGHLHACAIDAEGVICWGKGRYGATQMPNATF